MSNNFLLSSLLCILTTLLNSLLIMYINFARVFTDHRTTMNNEHTCHWRFEGGGGRRPCPPPP